MLRKICYTLGATAAVAAMAIGGFATAGAATSACGKACFDVGFVDPGSGAAILASNSGRDTAGNLVRLLAGSNGLPSEDFAKITLGTIVPAYCTATGQAATGSLFTSSQCQLLVTDGYAKSQTYELAFNPNNGGPEDMCIGGWKNEVANGWKARLTPCGVAADTVIIKAAKLPGGNTQTGNWYINGASDNFSNPLVLTNPGYAPSQVTWTTINLNGKHAADNQEVHSASGPF